MPEIVNRNLANARLLVGPQFTRVRGASSEGVTISPVEDEGGVMTGVQGDTYLWSKPMTACTIVVNCNPGSAARKTLLDATAGGPAPFKYQDGQYDIFGTYVIQNRGDVTMTNNAQSITLACALIKDSNEPVGTIVQVA